MAAKKMYAWSDLYYGGKTEERARANGLPMRVVLSRDIVPRGEEVTQSKLGVDDDQWQALQDSGSVREYPLPKGADEFTSPARAMVAALVNEQGDIDVNKLLELGLQNPPAINPPASENAPVGA